MDSLRLFGARTRLVRGAVETKTCGFGECNCSDCDTRVATKIEYQDKLDRSGLKVGEKVVIVPSEVLSRIIDAVGAEKLISLWNL